MNRLTLSEIIPTEILQQIQDAFSRYSGLAAIIADSNGTPITKPSNFTGFCKLTRGSECGSIECQRCGRNGAKQVLKTGRPTVYNCHAGMVDFAAPILLNSEYIGHFAGGQSRDSELDEGFIREKAREYDIDEDEYYKRAEANEIRPREDVERAAAFLTELAAALSRIAFERAKFIEEKERIERIADVQSGYLHQYARGVNDDVSKMTAFFASMIDGTRKEIDPAAKAFAKRMTNNIHRHAAFLNESIDYLEIETDSFKLQEKAYDIRAMLAIKTTEYMPEAKSRRMELSYNVDEDVPRFLVGDTVRIGEIIGRCMDSGFNFGRGESLFFGISARKEGYARILVIKYINDNIRMDIEEQKRLKYYILNRGRDKNLWDFELEKNGISTISQLIEAMNGRISFGAGDDPYRFEMIFEIPQLEA